MIQVRRTEFFDEWLARLKDEKAKARVAARIDRLAHGNPGDVKPAGGRVSELRIDYGPGFRVYFTRRGKAVIILLAGGDKGSQEKDIRAANALVTAMKD